MLGLALGGPDQNLEGTDVEVATLAANFQGRLLPDALCRLIGHNVRTGYRQRRYRCSGETERSPSGAFVQLDLYGFSRLFSEIQRLYGQVWLQMRPMAGLAELEMRLHNAGHHVSELQV